jgi:DNA-binding NtrC family response regulator
MMTGDDRTTLFDSHPWMLEIRSVIESIANTDAKVLIRGESSRMCELVARAVHASSARHLGPFVRVYCAVRPPIALESTLFGAEGETRTGALARKRGVLEFSGSTLYLQDIASLPLALQTKLLQVLKDRRLSRGGGRAPINVDVRVIAATNRDLEDSVALGEFLEELYYLLKGAEVPVPPLTKEERDLAPAATDSVR